MPAGVLVARHDAELSTTTDVASRAEFAHLRTTHTIDGVGQCGWFAQDFTVAELKTLAARERMPGTRPANVHHEGAEGVPTLTEVLAMVGAESARRGSTVGVMLELKHATHHDAIGLPFDDRLLLDKAPRHPADLVEAGGSWSYGDLITREGLAWIDEYADGIGPHKSLVLPRDSSDAIALPSTLVRDAHRQWLTVFAWTVRGENCFLPSNLRVGTDPDALGDMAAEVGALLAAGVDGVITDHPEVALRTAREACSATIPTETLQLGDPG